MRFKSAMVMNDMAPMAMACAAPIQHQVAQVHKLNFFFIFVFGESEGYLTK